MEPVGVYYVYYKNNFHYASILHQETSWSVHCNENVSKTWNCTLYKERREKYVTQLMAMFHVCNEVQELWYGEGYFKH